MGNIEIDDTSLCQEATKMLSLAERMANSMLEHMRTNEVHSSDNFQSIVSAVRLSKCFRAQLWEDSIYMCKQLCNLGHKYSRILAARGKTSYQALITSEPREIAAVS